MTARPYRSAWCQRGDCRPRCKGVFGGTPCSCVCHTEPEMEPEPVAGAPYYDDGVVQLWLGDCVEVMATLPDAAVDSVVTDPPYDLTAGKKGGSGEASLNPNSPAGRSRISTGGGFMGQGWDATGVAFDQATWAEAMRVLKPGGHLLAFGGTRTYHRLASAIEDAGFEIRDSIHWIYSQGFPKSMNVGDGRGTALKPAHEAIVLARKPLIGTVSANLAKHGTGALNIDACRVGDGSDSHGREGEASAGRRYTDVGGTNFAAKPGVRGGSADGRWPANVAFGDVAAVELDSQTGVLTSGKMQPTHTTAVREVYGQNADGGYRTMETYGDSGGASRFFPVFRYEAKAPQEERPTADGVSHPTVKPLDLMRWLVRLVTPPGGTVLEPFAGSGTTAEACVVEGLRCIAIEKHEPYLPLIVARLSKPIQPDLFGAAS